MAGIVSRNLIEILIRARDEASKDLKKSGDNVAVFEKRIAVAGAAVAAAGAAMIAAVSSAAIAGGRYADSLDDLSDRTLVSRETLAALGTQLVKGGGQFDDAEVSVRTFSRAVIDAISGQKEAVAQFERLGISVDDLVGDGGRIKGFEELLPVVADGFANVRDEAAALDSAVALFGRSATSLVPILSKGAAGIRGAHDEARRLNTILGGDLQSNAGRLGDRLDDLKLSVIGTNNALAGALDPTLGRIITGFADAAKAAGEFAEQHPQLVRNIVGTTAALTALAATPGTIALVTRAITALRLEMVGASVAAAVFGKSLGPLFVQGRNAAGQFTALRATTLGWVAGLGLAVTAVAALTAAVGALVSMQQEAADRARADDAAADQHTETLRKGTASIEEQTRALRELREVQGRQAVRETRTALASVGARERVVFEERARQQAFADFDARMAGFRRDLERRANAAAPVIVAGIEVKPALKASEIPALVEFPDTPPTASKDDAQAFVAKIRAQYNLVIDEAMQAPISAPAPKVVIAPIDPDDLNAQIALQRQVVEKARGELALARQTVIETAQLDDKGIRDAATDKESEAAAKLSRELQSLASIQQRAADRTRDLARAAAEARTALLDFDAATGRISFDQLIEANARALDESVAALEKARAAQAAAVPGTTAYKNATEALTVAIDQEREARQRLGASVDESNAKAAADRQAVQQQTDAVTALAQAEQDLATVQSAKKANVASYQLEIATLERLKVAMDEARIAASTQAGPVSPERFQAAADATRAFADATLQARQAQEQLGVTFDASGLAVQQFGGLANTAMSALGGATVDAASIARGAISSIIQELLRMIATAKAAKIATAAIGGGLPIGPFAAIPALLGLQGGGRVVNGIRGVDSVNARVGAGEAILDHRLSDKLDAFLSSFDVARRAPQESVGASRARGGDVTNHLHFHGILAGSTSDAQKVSRTVYESQRDYQQTGIAAPRFA